MQPDASGRHRRRSGEEIGQILLDPVGRPPRRLLHSGLLREGADREHALIRLDQEVLQEAGGIPDDRQKPALDHPDQLLHRVAGGELVLARGEIRPTRSWRAGHRAGLLGRGVDDAAGEERSQTSAPQAQHGAPPRERGRPRRRATEELIAVQTRTLQYKALNLKTVDMLSAARPLGAWPPSRSSRRTEPLVMDDLGERLAGLWWVGARPLGAGVLVTEGEGSPHQPLARDTQDLLGRLPARAVEPAD